MTKKLLIINPGGTTTKIGVFTQDAAPPRVTSLEHSALELAPLHGLSEQAEFRKEVIERTLSLWQEPLEGFAAFVSRGGPLKSLPAGTYAIDQVMLGDIRGGRVQTEHPSLTGALIAHALASEQGRPSFIVDPVSVDEMLPEARLSGLKDLPRRSLWHSLNSRHAARVACERKGLDYRTARIVVAHLGSGISVTALSGGRALDTNNANDQGPFAPTRAGGLPATGLVDLCFQEGASRAAIRKRLTRAGGLIDHCGTSDFRAVRERALGGDGHAKLVMDAMGYQIAKEIGAMAAVMGGAELIVFTGGVAFNDDFIAPITARTDFIAPAVTLPGEFEMQALAAGAWRVLDNEEKALSYAAV